MTRLNAAKTPQQMFEHQRNASLARWAKEGV